MGDQFYYIHPAFSDSTSSKHISLDLFGKSSDKEYSLQIKLEGDEDDGHKSHLTFPPDSTYPDSSSLLVTSHMIPTSKPESTTPTVPLLSHSDGLLQEMVPCYSPSPDHLLRSHLSSQILMQEDKEGGETYNPLDFGSVISSGLLLDDTHSIIGKRRTVSSPILSTEDTSIDGIIRKTLRGSSSTPEPNHPSTLYEAADIHSLTDPSKEKPKDPEQITSTNDNILKLPFSARRVHNLLDSTPPQTHLTSSRILTPMNAVPKVLPWISVSPHEAWVVEHQKIMGHEKKMEQESSLKERHERKKFRFDSELRDDEEYEGDDDDEYKPPERVGRMPKPKKHMSPTSKRSSKHSSRERSLSHVSSSSSSSTSSSAAGIILDHLLEPPFAISKKTVDSLPFNRRPMSTVLNVVKSIGLGISVGATDISKRGVASDNKRMGLTELGAVLFLQSLDDGTDYSEEDEDRSHISSDRHGITLHSNGNIILTHLLLSYGLLAGISSMLKRSLSHLQNVVLSVASEHQMAKPISFSCASFSETSVEGISEGDFSRGWLGKRKNVSHIQRSIPISLEESIRSEIEGEIRKREIERGKVRKRYLEGKKVPQKMYMFPSYGSITSSFKSTIQIILTYWIELSEKRYLEPESINEQAVKTCLTKFKDQG
ncbi:hypothetical protein ADUPG1_008185 [Aduncisulcus paluster]|uniref:Uncharacterized protein n=1 Tax=Aduncisulcus paluster TaxID=2918883 RepID=A0ABQ5KR26_9EUKA|nr:hypothetical protein ADUPG1_008185 [Aduncisulcus paluster]